MRVPGVTIIKQAYLNGFNRGYAIGHAEGRNGLKDNAETAYNGHTSVDKFEAADAWRKYRQV